MIFMYTQEKPSYFQPTNVLHRYSKTVYVHLKLKKTLHIRMSRYCKSKKVHLWIIFNVVSFTLIVFLALFFQYKYVRFFNGMKKKLWIAPSARYQKFPELSAPLTYCCVYTLIFFNVDPWKNNQIAQIIAVSVY